MSDFNQFVQQVVDFYGGGGPKKVAWGDAGGGTLGIASGNNITLNQALLAKLQALAAAPRSRPAAQQGIEALGTLIHEALHTRPDPWPGMRGIDGGGVRDPRTGLYSPDDEWQAHQLAYNLVPDAMQRFFGVNPNSSLGAFYQALAQGRGYGGTLGGPGAAGAHGNMNDRVFYL